MVIAAKKAPLDWVYAAKGIGLFLVVTGHFYPEFSPRYWSELRKIIYSFHMPLFFVLSGYLYQHGRYSYIELIRKKTERLLYPFVSIAMIFFLIKLFAGRYVHLDHPVGAESIYALLTDPVHSYMPLLWFVHSLFIIFMVYPPVRAILNNITMLILLVVINMVAGHDYPVFGKSLANMPFFVVGIMLKESTKFDGEIESDEKWNILLFLAVFVSIYILILTDMGTEHGRWYIIQFSLGLAGSLLVINLSRIISMSLTGKIEETLINIGYYSTTIYLFHTFFESAARIGFLQILKQPGLPFEITALIAITAGIILPLLLEKYVLRRNRYTRKFLLGLE